MKQLYIPGEADGNYFLLLHGTGGDETSLVEIAQFLDKRRPILSFRGTVIENGMNRFFKRNGLNQFDLASLEKETDQLYSEIKQASQHYQVPLENWILVGYSNGANIAAHLLLERKTPFKQAILFHPMFLGVQTQRTDLSDKRIFLTYGGENDPIVSGKTFEALKEAFLTRNANVTLVQGEWGHQLTRKEVQAAKEWLNTQERKEV